MDPKQEFLILLKDYKTLRETLKNKAWEITPSDIRESLCGQKGLLADNAKQALEWLIKPNWRLNDKSPIEAILDNDTDEVTRLLDALKYSMHI